MATLKLGVFSLNRSEIARALQRGYVAVIARGTEGTEVLHLECKYKDNYLNRWLPCTFGQATHVFVKRGPRAIGRTNHVGTYYPNGGNFWIGPAFSKGLEGYLTRLFAHISNTYDLPSATEFPCTFELASTDRNCEIHVEETQEHDFVDDTIDEDVPEREREHVSASAVRSLKSMIHSA